MIGEILNILLKILIMEKNKIERERKEEGQINTQNMMFHSARIADGKLQIENYLLYHIIFPMLWTCYVLAF